MWVLAKSGPASPVASRLRRPVTAQSAGEHDEADRRRSRCLRTAGRKISAAHTRVKHDQAAMT